MSGDDSFTHDIMKIGGKGVISVASNIVPERIQRFLQ
jgi:dihydrodipicolinate synthase/N-acetylneuraminate lyase